MWLVGSVILVVCRFMHALPLRVARMLARFAGVLMYYFIPHMRTLGMKNLDLAYGDSLARDAKKKILLDSFRNTAMLAAEVPHTGILSTPEGRALYTFEGYEHVDSSKGALLITGHFANWEWMSGIVGTLEQGAVALGNHLAEPRIHAYANYQRTRHGLRMFDKNDALQKIIREAREGRLVALLIDQRARTNSVPTTFFGKPCWSTAGSAMLALRTKVPVHPMSFSRDETGHYTLRIHPAIDYEPESSFQDNLIRMTQRHQDAIEDIVRADPGQWTWYHNRWKPVGGQVEKWTARGVEIRS